MIHRRQSRGLPLEDNEPSYALQSPDGEFLCAAARLHGANGKPFGKRVGVGGAMVWFVPAVEGDYYLAMAEVKPVRQGGSPLALEIHTQGQEQSLLTVHDLPGIDGRVDWNAGRPMQWEHHLFYVADANLLAVIPKARDKLILHRIDIVKRLEESDIDYLLVTSKPPTEFRPGAILTYKMEGKAKKGGLKFKLESGPDGMTLSPEGTLKWPVPAKVEEDEVNVIITVGDAAGQEIFHNLKLTNAGPALRK